jgi:YD repeat-containing protein
MRGCETKSPRPPASLTTPWKIISSPKTRFVSLTRSRYCAAVARPQIGSPNRTALTLFPLRSIPALVALTRYSASGMVEETEDANGIITRQEYDDAGRIVKTVENYQPTC